MLLTFKIYTYGKQNYNEAPGTSDIVVTISRYIRSNKIRIQFFDLWPCFTLNTIRQQ